MSELVLARRADLRTLPEKMNYAREMAESGMLPAQYRKNPANVLWAVEYGQMLNLAPMAAITGVHVIEGKPSASAALISGLVRSAGHKLRVWGDDRQATAQIIRSDDPEFDGFKVTWTIQKAKNAELLGKKNWRLYPEAMLKARAISQVARDACEECLFGLHYTPEELGVEDTNEDGEPTTVESVRVDRPVTPPDRAELAKAAKVADLRTRAIAATDYEVARDLWKDANGRGLLDEPTQDADGKDATLGDVLLALGTALKPAGDAGQPSGKDTVTVENGPAAGPDDVVDAEIVATPPAAPKAEAPSAVTTPVDDAQTTADARPASRGLLSRIAVLLGELGVKDRGVKLMVCNVLANRADDDPLLTSNDLTSGEAKTVIGELEESGAREMVDAIIAAGKANT